ncbi:MAG: hypothetical protein H0V96_00975, partial [Acidimicrobiia bacterium]|nr:hypothetical protein [Acidimicrobiia bacterium]
MAGAGCGDASDGQAAPSTVASEAPATEPPTTTVPPPTTTSTTTLAPATSAAPTTSTKPLPPAPILPYRNATTLAEVLAAAEFALADPMTAPDDFTVWAQLQQQAYRDLVAHPDWQGAARRAMPEPFRDAFELNLEAGTHLRRLTSPQPGLPDWTIVAPPPLAQLR